MYHEKTIHIRELLDEFEDQIGFDDAILSIEELIYHYYKNIPDDPDTRFNTVEVG
jgi:hypothetical protein